ncbi:MAG TPA: type 4a pilus biogenesis protein PilO, partial [Myxococcaceae bacterium]|nr:type 4a pilus biogenesis protein PilO [Myxococcaceae bacterium]
MEELLEKIQKAPLHYKLAGVAAAIIVITLINFLLLIQPLDDQIAMQENQKVELKRNLAQKKDYAQNLNERRLQLAKLERDLQEALTQLPEQRDMDELLAQINDIGRKSGLEISRVEPGTEVPAGFFAKIPIKMAVSGNYMEIAMFFQELSTMRRIVNVSNLKLGSGAVKNEKVVLNT